MQLETWYYRLWLQLQETNLRPQSHVNLFFAIKRNVNEVNFKNNDNILPPPTTDRYCGASDKYCPPQDQDKLMIMLRYIRKKKYMKDQLKGYRNTANILPHEQICHLCCGNFSNLLSVSTIAKIFCKEEYLISSLLSLSRILSWYMQLRWSTLSWYWCLFISYRAFTKP